MRRHREWFETVRESNNAGFNNRPSVQMPLLYLPAQVDEGEKVRNQFIYLLFERHSGARDNDKSSQITMRLREYRKQGKSHSPHRGGKCHLWRK